MAEKFFDRYEISTALQHVGCKCVPKGVWVRGVDTSSQTNFLDDAV
jgi:hypothetical protein